MAGQIAELAQRTLRRDFRRINTRTARVILLDAAAQVLPPFGRPAGREGTRRLEEIGVEVQLGATVVDVDEPGIEVQDTDGTRRRIECLTKVWAAGVQASALGRRLAEQTGAALDRAGRIGVRADLTLPGHPEVFVVGDMIVLKPPRRRAGRDPGRPVRGRGDHAPARRRAGRRGVRVPRQGQHGDDLPVPRGRAASAGCGSPASWPG